MHITAVALCAIGAEKIVSNELRKLGLMVAEAGAGRVRFRVEDIRGLYRSLIGLRAADRVLLEAGFFPASDFEALFTGVNAIPWEAYIPKGMGLSVVKVRSRHSVLAAETSIQAVTHKAAAERLCKAWNIQRLPEQESPAELRVYIEKDRASILLDLSGDPLFKRGYRREGGIAPLRETTAAAILLLSGWKRKYPLWDPFCGSGTILIEASLYAWDLAPGLGRSFSLENLLPADPDAEKEVRKEFTAKFTGTKEPFAEQTTANKGSPQERLIRIYGSDTDGRAVEMAQANAKRAACLAGPKTTKTVTLPNIRVQPMEEARPPQAGAEEASGTARGFIVTNPPYGRRLGDPGEAEKIYSKMGKLAQHFPGWKLALICDHPGFESFFGRKADSCKEITNGAVQCYFYQYEEL